MNHILEIAPGYAEAQTVTQVYINCHGTRVFFFAPTRGDVVCVDLHPHRSIHVTRHDTLQEAIKNMFATPADDARQMVRELFVSRNPKHDTDTLLERLEYEEGAELRVWEPEHASASDMQGI